MEQLVADRYRAQGHDPDWAKVGIYYEDPFCLMLRDALRFPDGGAFIHHRLLWKSGPVSGVVVLPKLGNEFVLVHHYRHAIGAWTWECPRGSTSPGESWEETAGKELLEEIGAEICHCRPLGRVFPITSLTNTCVVTFLAEIDRVGKPARSEGIDRIRLASFPELEEMISQGEITDAATICSIAQARCRI